VKIKRFFGLLATFITLTTVGVAIPTVPALAALTATAIYPFDGPIGTSIIVNGSGFAPGMPAYVRFDSYTNTNLQVQFTPPGDTYTLDVLIPVGLDGGPHEVFLYQQLPTVQYDSAGVFTVTPRFTEIDPLDGKVGGTITLEGDGFVSTSPSIYVYWDESRVNPLSGSTVSTTGATKGQLSNFRIAVPASTRGEHTIRVEDRKNSNLSAGSLTFNVGSTFNVEPTSGAVGDTLTCTGTGFGSGVVTVYFDQAVMRTVNTTNGGFTTNFTVPPAASGTHTIKAADSESLQVTFTMSQQMALSPLTPVFVGDSLTITGTGFPLNAPISVTLDGNPVTITPVPMTTSSGSINFSFPAPEATKGSHVVSIQVAGSAAMTATITIKEKMLGIEPTEGFIGDTISISGNGFAAGPAKVYMGTTQAEENIIIGSNGSFNGTFTIPQIAGGTYDVTITDSAGTLGTALGKVTVNPTMGITPTSGIFDDPITVTGSGFGPQKSLSIVIDGAYSLGNATSTNKGEIPANTTFTVPNLPKGQHTVRVSDSEGRYAEAYLTINQKYSIGTTEGKLGDRVSILGTGFAANRQITVSFGGASVQTDPSLITTNQYGSFSGFFTVPPSVAGPSTVSITDGANSGTATFTVELTCSIDYTMTTQNPGWVGQDLTITGYGFKAGVPVKVTFDDSTAVVGTINSNAQGSFILPFKVPALAKGPHTIKVTDGTTTKEFSFVMESKTPPVPVLISPSPAVKPQQPVTFNWGSVVDESGVTYDFQLSSSTSFSPGTIILDQTGLTDTTLTLPADQELPPAGGKTPYVWRVRSVDGAGNVSAWSSPYTFSIGFVWPDWIIHVWYGLGILAALILGLWLGRRMAYQSY
jgi:hypothetical protein